jgi:hypothetical protein
MPSTTLFLLSPANLNGLRARQLISPGAMFALAQRYRSEEGVSIGEAFAFMSALYFRGKIAYARRFAVPSPVVGLLAGALGPDDQVVLLGSVATGKYVDILWPILGDRLRFPSAFAGLGDMARGGLMLRSAREGKELSYVTLDASRKRAPGTSGKMPDL